MALSVDGLAHFAPLQKLDCGFVIGVQGMGEAEKEKLCK
jgi:hypothetical protein